jgi:hypothetical protein
MAEKKRGDKQSLIRMSALRNSVHFWEKNRSLCIRINKPLDRYASDLKVLATQESN